MECGPRGRVVVVKDAVPLGVSEAVPRSIVPSLKVNDPVGGIPSTAPETTAVNVTDWPAREGLPDEFSPV